MEAVLMPCISVAQADDLQPAASADFVKLPEKGVDIESRVATTTIANRLAFRVLMLWSQERTTSLSMEESRLLSDALDGLRACCYRAKGTLFAPLEPGDTPHGATRRFFEDRILAILSPFIDKSKEELEKLAVQGRFNNLPREIRCDLIDSVRKEYTTKEGTREKRDIDVDRIEDPHWQEIEHESDGDWEEEFHGRHFANLLLTRRRELVETLGRTGYGTLLAIALYLSKEGIDKRHLAKGELTAAIAAWHQVATRRATDLKRSLQLSLKKALENGDKLADRIHSLLTRAAMPCRIPPRSRRFGRSSDQCASEWEPEGNGTGGEIVPNFDEAAKEEIEKDPDTKE
jgi:hypothetical protein